MGGSYYIINSDDITSQNLCERFKEFPEFNGICVGEGEVPFIDLCERIDNDQDILDTPSFIFKTIDDSGKTSLCKALSTIASTAGFDKNP